MNAVKVREIIGAREAPWMHDAPLLQGGQLADGIDEQPMGRVVCLHDGRLYPWPVPVGSEGANSPNVSTPPYGILDAAAKAGESVRVGIRGVVRSKVVTLADNTHPSDEQVAQLRSLGLYVI